jgi:hypothetical protein
MDFNVKVKLDIYRHVAGTGALPAVEAIAERNEVTVEQILDEYTQLAAQRVLVLEQDGRTIRMAPPFSGVSTQHVVESDGIRYYANCAWDALGIVAALGKPATVHSRCEGSGEPLRLEVGSDGPEPCDWIFHSLVPAAQWWDDIVFT